MRHVAIGLLVLSLFVPGVGRAATEPTHPGTTPGTTKHSGLIVALSRRAKTLELEELGVQGRPLRRVIELRPDTKIERVARSAAAAPGQWPGGFEETPLTVTELTPGEFATVTTV